MTSVKVCEPATTAASRENSAERSFAPCTAAEGELSMARGLCHSKAGRATVSPFDPGRATDPKSSSSSSPLVPSSSAHPEHPPVPAPRKRPPEPAPPERPPVPAPRKRPPEPAPPERPPVPAPQKRTPLLAPIPEFSPGSPEAHNCPPPHPLLPPPPLASGSPSACPQPTIYAVRAPQDCHPPASLGLEYPSPPPPASEARTPPRPVDPFAPPWLLAPSSLPWPICPLAPPGFLVPLAPPWSGVDHPAPLGTPLLRLHLIPPAPSGSSIPSSPPHTSVAPAPPRPSGSPPRSPAPSASPWATGSSLSPLLFGSPSPPRAPPPPAPPPLVGPLESAPPWATVMAVAWVPLGSFCSRSLLAPPSFVASLVSVCRPPPGCPSSSRASSQAPTHPSLGCFYGARTRLPGGGRYVRVVDCFCCVFDPHVFPVTQFLPRVDCKFDSRCVSSSSPVILCLIAPVLSVSVCRFLNVSSFRVSMLPEKCDKCTV